MGILTDSIKRLARKKPLRGRTIASGLQLTKETAVLLMGVKDLGANVVACGGNPLTTQDDIAAFLDSQKVAVYAWPGQTKREYEWCQDRVLSHKPDIIMDDGGDLNIRAHQSHTSKVLGATEETTTGVTRYHALAKMEGLQYPIIAVNNARTKMMFDNRYGTGQSTIEALLRSANLLLASKTAVIAGYGWLGKGVARRCAGMGARVVVTEVDAVKALEAHMDGYEVLPMADAARTGDVFVTCTGMRDVITRKHMHLMKDGAILANVGHFDVEIDAKYLLKRASRQVRANLDECMLPNGRKVFLVSKGRVANLVASEGHPPEVMALSFSNQLHCILHLLRNHARMKHAVHAVPKEIDDAVARDALRSYGIRTDRPSRAQSEYLKGW